MDGTSVLLGLSLAMLIPVVIGATVDFIHRANNRLEVKKKELPNYDSMARGHYVKFDEKVESRVLEEANMLHSCRKCGKYSRTYQQVLAFMKKRAAGEEPKLFPERESIYTSVRPMRVERNRICPHCEGEICVFYSKDDWPWIDTHPDCPKIGYEGYHQYKNTLKEVEQLIYDMKSMEAYQKYNGFEVKGTSEFDVIGELNNENSHELTGQNKVFYVDKKGCQHKCETWGIWTDTSKQIGFNAQCRGERIELKIRLIGRVPGANGSIVYLLSCYNQAFVKIHCDTFDPFIENLMKGRRMVTSNWNSHLS